MAAVDTLTPITFKRQLAIVNKFVEIPDGQQTLRTKLTAADVLTLIPGAEYEKLGTLQRDQRWIVLPEEGRLSGPSADYYQILRDAAGL